MLYKIWAEKRANRLSKEANVFKELRNITLKEGPIKHESSVVNLNFGGAGIVIPPLAQVISPWFSTQTGRPNSHKAIIKEVSGKTYEVSPLVEYDFHVNIISNSKDYKIDHFIKKARNYLLSIKTELEEADKKFKSN